jgi:preprotein translocase subunit SecB
MDKEKDATIKVEAIILEKMDFERQQQVSEDIFQSQGEIDTVKLKMDVKIDRQLSTDKKKLMVKFELSIFDEKKTLNILCRMVGVFVQSSEGSMNLEEFGKVNAPTFLFPYLRENISSITMKAGLPPIVLPPLNMVKLMNDNPVVKK